MHLTDGDLAHGELWARAGIELPAFDRAAMKRATAEAPEWVHFGAGNIFRIFPLAMQQTLLEKGLVRTGVIMVAGRDGGIVDQVFKPCDNLTLAVTLKADGSVRRKVVASAASSYWMGSPADWDALKAIFHAPSLKMGSLTITEKGYNLYDGKGALNKDAAADCAAGPGGATGPQNYIAKITALLYERYRAGGNPPLAMVSMDNCSRNGDKLRGAVETFADAWAGAGLVDKGFPGYLRERVGFPCTMIDKITPGPDQGVKAALEKDGFEDTWIYAKTTPTSPFVNAEEPQYLVIEDRFPGGRPPLEKAGALFTDRETVDKVEKMKVCTCLNPLHTALALFGCLLGYTRIAEEMKNPDLVKLVEGIGYREGLPVVVDPGVLSPRAFLDEVIRTRLPNPFMPDAPQRIASDTSQKLPVRFGETLKAYLANPSLNARDLNLIPLTLAAWPRYLMGVDDAGKPFTVSPDPRGAEFQARVSGIALGARGPFHEALEPIFRDAGVFGVDLYQAGLGEKAEGMFAELVAGPGAVAATLRKYV